MTTAESPEPLTVLLHGKGELRQQKESSYKATPFKIRKLFWIIMEGLMQGTLKWKREAEEGVRIREIWRWYATEDEQAKNVEMEASCT